MEDLALNPAPHFLPRVKVFGSSFNGRDATSDLSVPGGLGIWIGWAVNASQQLGGQFGARPEVESQGVRENSLGRAGHGPSLVGIPAPL